MPKASTTRDAPVVPRCPLVAIGRIPGPDVRGAFPVPRPAALRERLRPRQKRPYPTPTPPRRHPWKIPGADTCAPARSNNPPRSSPSPDSPSGVMVGSRGNSGNRCVLRCRQSRRARLPRIRISRRPQRSSEHPSGRTSRPICGGPWSRLPASCATCRPLAVVLLPVPAASAQAVPVFPLGGRVRPLPTTPAPGRGRGHPSPSHKSRPAHA